MDDGEHDTTASTPTRSVDRRVLVGNLVPGLALAGASAVASWPLAVAAAVYVIVVSLFFGVAYARQPLRRRQELVVWLAPWAVAIALWAVILAGVDGGGDDASDLLVGFWGGTIVGTGCYLGWQALALAGRRLIGSDPRPDGVSG